jgi:predicted metalloprotease with PDZ domain
MPFELDDNGMPKLPFGNDGQPTLPDVAPAVNAAYLGVEYELITPEEAARENMTGTTGALIKTVAADSPAAKAGLKAGDVIQRSRWEVDRRDEQPAHNRVESQSRR